MTATQLRERLRAKPFQPFTLFLADGRNISVKHPELMMISPKGRTVAIYNNDDSTSILDVMLVTEVRTKPGNGRSSRKK